MQYDLILEELSDSQKSKVDKWVKPGRRTIDISSHVFPAGHERVTIPVQDPKDRSVPAPEHIANHLKEHGYEVHDYLNGRAKDKHGREVKLGKALRQTKAPAEYIDHFNADPKRNAARLHGDLHVVVSRHPYDVAGMSTNRGWTSCMDMDGCHDEQRHLKHDVHEGTHVAYLVRKGDHNIENPVARIALKPHTSLDGTHTVLRPEDRTYGGAASSFGHTVNKWATENFPLNKGHVYTKNTKIYDDAGDMDEGILMHPDADHKAIAGELAKHKSAKTGSILGALYKNGDDDAKNHIMSLYNKDKAPHHRLMWSVAENGPAEHHHQMLDHWPAHEDVNVSLSYNSKHDDVHERIIRSTHSDDESKWHSFRKIGDHTRVQDLAKNPKMHDLMQARKEFHPHILEHGDAKSHLGLVRSSEDYHTLKSIANGEHPEAAKEATRKIELYRSSGRFK